MIIHYDKNDENVVIICKLRDLIENDLQFDFFTQILQENIDFDSNKNTIYYKLKNFKIQ